MEKKTTRFLNISLVIVSIFCTIIFIGQTVWINIMGENTIRQLGVFYMSGISDQVSSHFGTIIELRLAQVESLVNSVPPGRITSESAMRINLNYNARSAGFEYLALYGDDGGFQMLYGSQVTPDLPEALRQSVQGGEYNVCAGRDAADNSIVLIGVPAVYPMSDGGSSIALIAGLPTSYLTDTLESNIKSSFIEYSIIRNDGSYVLSNFAVEEANYFERVENLYEPLYGKTPAQYAQELQDALENDIDYTSEAMIDGERWNVYCTNLPNSDWHLLLKISHNTLDETVHLLQGKWTGISISGGCLIICALLVVFVGYYRLTKLHVRALDDARKTAEQAKLSAERSNRAKSEFLSNMSHDIRTPMNGIMGMTSIAISSLDNPERVRSCLKKIHISSRHLLGLITDMLDMSKIESGSLTLNMEPVSIREVMLNTMTMIQPLVQEKNQNFHIYVHDVYQENVCTDRVRMCQILVNILGNAIKYTPEGGSIEMNLFEEPSPKGDDYVRSHLHIKDNGIGMSKEFQSHIFEAFAREDQARVDKEAGAGMGMTIVKYIVDSMGGAIEVESEQGKGTCFRIAVDMEKATQQEKPLRLPSRNVLVIDDDVTSGELAVSALESIGLHAESSADLKRAVQRIEDRRSKNTPYHIVLLDWDIQGRDGMQVAKELVARLGPSLPVVLLTNGEWDELEAKREESGVSGFISKPLFRSSLYYGLRHFIEAKAPQPEPEPEPEAGVDLAGRRILIAEDNDLNWEIASEILCEFGLETERAENGQVCAEKFEAAAPGWYDAVLMDLRMPIKTGFEAAVAIRRSSRPEAKTIPIIAVSADTFPDDVQKCLDCGMNAHVPKPLDPEKILDLLSQYLH